MYTDLQTHDYRQVVFWVFFFFFFLFLSVIPSYAAVPRLLLGAYVWSPPTATSAARATWLLWREKAPTGLASQCYQEREREGHQVLFQNNQSTSQAFAGFG